MTQDQLKAATQPYLDQDFDALFDEYVEENADSDPGGFIGHLASFGLIDTNVAKDIMRQIDASEGTGPPKWEGEKTAKPKGSSVPIPPADFNFDDFDDDVRTVVAGSQPAPPPRPKREKRDKIDTGNVTAFGFLDEELPHRQEVAKKKKKPSPSKATPAPAPPPPPPGITKTATPISAPRKISESSVNRSKAPPSWTPPEQAAKSESAPSGSAASDSAPSDSAPSGSPPSNSGIGSGQFVDIPDNDDLSEEIEEDDDSKQSRTMFRRMTDGALKESSTGVIEKKKRVRRRRRRKKDAPPPVGEEGRYNFIGSVGEGAMGKVHLAEDTRLNRKVAFKAMSEEISKVATLASKFTSEAQITAQLDHPNIVPIYNLETASSYTMKLIKGITVEDLINECKTALEAKKTLDEVHSLNGRLDLFLRACDAMFYAHCRGVVHRDLKPENVMVGEFNELYIMDWGISKVMNGEFEDAVRLDDVMPEDDELVIGTPGYMSPEQAEGQNNDLDGRSDQYSLGLILFELVTLRPAVTGKTAIKMVMRHQDGEKDPMVHIKSVKIAPELKAIIHKATAKNRDARYESVRALADDIRRYLREEAVFARPDNPIQRLLRFMGKHRQLTLMVMMALFMGSATIAISAVAFSQITVARREARQQLVQNLLTRTAGQSSLIDGQFLKYEGLLSLIAVTSEDSLARLPRGNPTLYTDSDFDEQTPPGLINGKRYETPVSLSNAAYVLAPDVRESAVRGAMGQLSGLDRHYYRVLLRSHSEGAASWTRKRAQRALTDVGVPIAWVYVGLENGLYSGFPGHGSWPETFDHREQAWYAMAQAKRGPNWGAPSVDVSGMGLVLTCGQPLYDTEDNFLGVAGIDVTFDYIIKELLVLPGIEDAPNTEAFLLDPKGNIVIRSNADADEVRTEGSDGALEMAPFEYDEVVAKIKEKRSGSAEVDGKLVFYNRMNSIGWYYVIAGPESEILDLAD